MSPRLSIAELNDMLRTSFLTGTVIYRDPGWLWLPASVRTGFATVWKVCGHHALMIVEKISSH